MVASRNRDIAFAILTSTPGVTGADEHEYDRTRLYLHWMPPAIFSGIFADSIYFFEKKKFIHKPEQGFNRILYDNFYKGIVDVERQIIPQYDDYDSIIVRISESFYKKWDGTATKPYVKDLRKEYQIDEWVQMYIKTLFSPRYIAFSKWNPRQYLPTIVCPTLMLYGEKDLNINLKAGVDSVQQIIEDFELSNFTLKYYKGLDHFLSPYNEEDDKEGMPQGGRTKSDYTVPDSVYVDIREWMNKNIK